MSDYNFNFFVASVDLDHNNGMITIYDTGKGMDSTPQNSISKW